MGSKDRGLTKAEKRWQRQQRERELELQRLAELPQEPAGDDLEEHAAVQRFEHKKLAELRAQGLSDPVRVSVEELYGVKLSKALLDVCAPLLAVAGSDPTAIKAAIMIGIVGWNKACVPDLSIDDLLAETGRTTKNKTDSMKAAKAMRGMVESISQTKLELYPKMDLLIMDHEVLFQNGQLHVNVVGSPIGKSIDDVMAAVGEAPASRKTGPLSRLRGLFGRKKR